MLRAKNTFKLDRRKVHELALYQNVLHLGMLSDTLSLVFVSVSLDLPTIHT